MDKQCRCKPDEWPSAERTPICDDFERVLDEYGNDTGFCLNCDHDPECHASSASEGAK